MSSFTLLFWIAAGIIGQLVIYLCISFWRHWRNYVVLKSQAADLNLTAVQFPAEPVDEKAVMAWTGFRSFRVSRKIIEDAAGTVCSFYLAPEDKQPTPPFLPGQFLTFCLELPTNSGGIDKIFRCYSLSDAPRTDGYRVSIKRISAPSKSKVPPGKSSNFFHDQVEVDSVLQVRAPSGHFYLDSADTPLVLIAGGIGITPLLSMLNGCVETQPAREIWLFYGVRNENEWVMKAHFEALAERYPNFHLHFCLSGAQRNAGANNVRTHHGHINVDLLRSLLALKPYHFYICGPAQMMESLVPALENWGVPDSHIHFEAFGPASIQRKPAGTSPEVPVQSQPTDSNIVVTFANSGKQFNWQPGATSLLDFAESKGIAVSFGCRGGACGTCQTKIQSGEVVYGQPPDFDPEPGNCLICTCSPKTNVTLEL
jgi:ferredoxin-NADP reductase